jgi:predicted amidophosphoribosyltransferase
MGVAADIGPFMGKDSKPQTFGSFGELAGHFQSRDAIRKSEERQQILTRAVGLANAGHGAEAVDVVDSCDWQDASPAEQLQCGVCYAAAGRQCIADGKLAPAHARLIQARRLGYAPWHVGKRLDLLSRFQSGHLEDQLPSEWAGRFELTCGNCDKDSPSPLVCARCRGVLMTPALPVYQTHVSGLYALGVYRWQGDPDSLNVLSRAIRWLKGHDGKSICQYLAFLLVSGLRGDTKFLARADVVVPVPADPERIRERGCDNVAELSAHVATFSLMPLATDVLLKVKGSTDLRHLSWADRPEAIAGTMAINQKKASLLEGTTVLLVDDVVTSGSTLDLAAELLRKAGAREVLAVVLARSESSQASDRLSRRTEDE